MLGGYVAVQSMLAPRTHCVFEYTWNVNTRPTFATQANAPRPTKHRVIRRSFNACSWYTWTRAAWWLVAQMKR